MKAVVAFNQEKALVGAFFMIIEYTTWNFAKIRLKLYCKAGEAAGLLVRAGTQGHYNHHYL